MCSEKLVGGVQCQGSRSTFSKLSSYDVFATERKAAIKSHQQLMRWRIWASVLMQSPILHVDCMQGANIVRTRYAEACPQGAHFQAQALQLKH